MFGMLREERAIAAFGLGEAAQEVQVRQAIEASKRPASW
jgi:hypothetical protein